MENRAPAVVAVVVTTGPGPGLEATLASLVGQDYPDLSLLVLANGDHPDVAARVAALAPTAFVKVLEENRGFAAACNEAAVMVDGAAFWLFCHDDVRLDADCVSRLVETAYRANAGIVTPKFVDYDDPLTLLHVGQNSDRFGVVRERVEPGEIDHGQQDLERDVFVAPGGTTLVRADLFATLRGFDPLIAALGEDLDLCWRAQLAGARIVVAPLARVAHRASIARRERPVTAVGTRRASLADLQRRHQLLVVATGWGRTRTIVTLVMLAVLDVTETILALVLRDADRAGAIAGSWRWAWRQRRRIVERRRQIRAVAVLSDDDLHRLQVAGALRLRDFVMTVAREGLDAWRDVVPAHEPEEEPDESVFGVNFAGAFSEQEEFDDLALPDSGGPFRRPSRLLTSFRSQAVLVVTIALIWLIGSRNIVAMHLPLIGRLAPLDSWWSTWRHFFASWSPNGVGTGTPGMPGYGPLAFAGTFVFGRMGVLPRVALLAAVPLGAFGVNRLVRGRISNRARLVASTAYLVFPLGLNMIAQGRVDVLVAVAALPFLVRRTFELMDVPGFRVRPYGEAVPFGHRGWRASENGQRVLLIMVTALAVTMAPAVLIDVILVIAGVALVRTLDGDERGRPLALVGSLVGNVALFVLPLTVDMVFAGRRALEVFGLPRGPWSTPSFLALVRGADGPFGGSWTGWLIPVAAFGAVLIARHERASVVRPLAGIATLALTMAGLVSRGWLGPFAPDLDVLLALVGVVAAVLCGYGIAAIEKDLADTSFGWRQVTAGTIIVAMVALLVPLLTAAGSGRFNLPSTSEAESLSTLTSSATGNYRVLWLADPSVLPLAGWNVAPGLAAATSTNGLPAGNTLFTSPASGTSDVVLHAVDLALHGQTIRMGSLLAPAGVASVVVMQSAAPVLAGVQGSPVHPVPAALSAALGRQSDLAVVLATPTVAVYANTAFHGVTVAHQGTTVTPVFTNGTTSGPVPAGSTVSAALAPAGAFALNVDGVATPRSTGHGWWPRYRVPAGTGSRQATLVLHQFPLNGLLAAFTLGLWLIVWLGFGVVARLEWIFTRPRPRLRRRHS